MSNLDPVVQIGDWHYQVVYGEIWPATAAKPEHPQRLEPRLHSLLNFFLRHPNILLAKDTLIDKVWPAEEGTDAAVMRAVGALRKILGDDVRTPGYIATVSKKGYCWLAEIKPVELLAPVSSAEGVAIATAQAASELRATTRLQKPALPWRFITITALVVLLCCASLAYVLAKFTAAPLVRLPDTITPVSALSGQEYWPLLSRSHSHVVYQHRPPQQLLLNWSVQNLTDLKVEHLPQQYQALSEPVWLDDDSLIFRATTAEYACAFYQQQLLPQVKPPQLQRHWPCYQVQTQALLRWQEQWLWADAEADSTDILLFAAKETEPAALVNRITNRWRQLNGIQLFDNTLYLLVQQSFSSSALYRLTLPDGQPELVTAFPYLVEQFSWWSKNQLLLSAVGRELEILDLKAMTMQRLGPLTTDLAQASRAPGQVLATQYLDYTTDIYHVGSAPSELSAVKSWHVSNRSERLVAASEFGTAFVSERSGHAQLWLAQGADSTQLTRLNEQQQLQQVLWHNGDLLLLVNNQLFRFQLSSGSLTPYLHDITVPGRFASCHNTLYWTALTASGWQLFTQSDTNGANARPLMHNVVDVRCAPEQGLVLQMSGQENVALLRAEQLSILPLQLNWRQLTPEQWFSDDSGIYWLDKQQQALKQYSWRSGAVSQQALPQLPLPLAIYSQGNGLGYIVRQRPHDTDIVWLKNRR